MSKKIILVIENPSENAFLDKLLRRLGFNVSGAKSNGPIGQELASFVPDLVFASMIGKSSNTLKALAKIKSSRGIPKVVFVRGAQETKPLSNEQKQIVDGLLKSPIDPFDLLEILSEQLDLPLEDLKEKYRSIMRGSGAQNSKSSFGELVAFSTEKSERYQKVVDGLSKDNFSKKFDSKKLRQIGSEQSKGIEQDENLVELKKKFLKKLLQTN